MNYLPLQSRARRLFLCFALFFAITVGQLACGISGGSIPPGRAAALLGRVISSEAPTVPIKNAQLTLIVTPDNGISTEIETRTDANGNFSLPNLPAGVNFSEVILTLKPQSPDLRVQQIQFRIPAQHTATLIAAVTRVSTDISQIASVGITPTRITVDAGEQIRFTPLFKDALGKTLDLPLAATLLLTDDVGALKSDGTFVANSTGAVNVRVFWYDGLSSTASVNVQTPVGSGNQIPPAPPAETN